MIEVIPLLTASINLPTSLKIVFIILPLLYQVKGRACSMHGKEMECI
jgi:hypothetical protein